MDFPNGKQVYATDHRARAILILLFGSVVSSVDVYMILNKNGEYNVKYRYIYITHEEVVFCLEGAYPKMVVTVAVLLNSVHSLSTVSGQFVISSVFTAVCGSKRRQCVRFFKNGCPGVRSWG
jgi:hypothetical protein